MRIQNFTFRIGFPSRNENGIESSLDGVFILFEMRLGMRGRREKYLIELVGFIKNSFGHKHLSMLTSIILTHFLRMREKKTVLYTKMSHQLVDVSVFGRNVHSIYSSAHKSCILFLMKSVLMIYRNNRGECGWL